MHAASIVALAVTIAAMIPLTGKESQRMLEDTNRLGAIVAVAFYVSAILIFVFRLLDMPHFGNWIGYFEFLLAIPLIYLLLKAPQLQRPTLYYIQIGCMLVGCN
jgi:hypothetical protein